MGFPGDKKRFPGRISQKGYERFISFAEAIRYLMACSQKDVEAGPRGKKRYFKIGSMCIKNRQYAKAIEWFSEGDLPPKKWTQRRVGFRIETSSKEGGVQWKGKREKRDDLIGILRYPRSKWLPKVDIRRQRLPGGLESTQGGFISGRSSSEITAIRHFPVKGI